MSDTNTNNSNIQKITNTLENNQYNEQYNEQFMKQLDTYRKMVISFNNNKADLLKIYIQHRNNAIDERDKIAVLGIQLIIDEKPNVDIAYLPVHVLESEIAKKIHERMEINNEHIIYFLMITPCEEQILEIDARDLL